MTTAALPTRSMAFTTVRRAPLHLRFWESLMAAGARRAASELRREAMLRVDTDPVMARQMLATARKIFAA